MPKRSSQKPPSTPVRWACTLAVVALVFSFFLWTGVLLLRDAKGERDAPVNPSHGAATELVAGFEMLAEITIPKIGVRAPVLRAEKRLWDARRWELLEQRMQTGLAHGTVAYPHSPRPGEHGNLIIAGHSSPPDERAEDSAYGDVFRRLPELEEGDVITVLTEDGGFVDYEVRTLQILSPDETDVLQQPRDSSLLTLITCYPVGTTKDRWVVTAERIDVTADTQ